MPTNNLNAERYLARFGYLASQSAQHSKKLFKARRIKDDLMLPDRDDSKVVKSANAVLKHLDEMEMTWSSRQKQKKKQRLKENLQKKLKANEFKDQLLIKYKEHGEKHWFLRSHLN